MTVGGAAGWGKDRVAVTLAAVKALRAAAVRHVDLRGARLGPRRLWQRAAVCPRRRLHGQEQSSCLWVTPAVRLSTVTRRCDAYLATAKARAAVNAAIDALAVEQAGVRASLEHRRVCDDPPAPFKPAPRRALLAHTERHEPSDADLRDDRGFVRRYSVRIGKLLVRPAERADLPSRKAGASGRRPAVGLQS